MSGCGTLPRDPAHTLERVADERRIRVGVSENPPWVIRTPAGPAGVEAQLIRDFAASLGATPEWIWGSEQPHMEALERFELDLVVAGLDAATAWSKRIGLTRPYFEERIGIGVPPGSDQPASLAGVVVAVKGGDAVAAYLDKKHARPVRVADITAPNQPAAGPEWKLQQLGFSITKFELLKRKHVMAVPPGENAWLKRLQDFLYERRGQINPVQKTEGQQ